MCSVPFCEFEQGILYGFPRKNEARKSKWRKACGFKIDEKLNDKKVCSHHFTDSDFDHKRNLVEEAHPTMNLPSVKLLE